MSKTAKIEKTVLIEIPETMFLDVVENGPCAFHQGILDKWRVIDGSKSLRAFMAYSNIETIEAQAKEIEALKDCYEALKETHKDLMNEHVREGTMHRETIDRLMEDK